jgi:hypothetical protein
MLRASPTGDSRLPRRINALGDRFQSALIAAVQRGATDEDASNGYALSSDPELRSVQEEFLEIASTRLDLLASVLRTSSDARQRALAAQVIGYGPDRQAVVRELHHALLDPSDEVRNNAARALALLAEWANQNPEAGLSFQVDLFINYLNSVSWTDRNKGIFVLMPLTARRDSSVLADLRGRALASLVEMARWSHDGHALGPYVVLARLAGVDDSEAFQAWQSGQREAIITRALSAK